MAGDSFLIDLLGGGEAQEAGKTVSARKQYNDYVTQKLANGEEPLPFDKWREENGL